MQALPIILAVVVLAVCYLLRNVTFASKKG